ncbi:putative transcriptional regulator [Streptococcus criceti]|nr:helix-turn-helix transcriptional regulator [Streptococcus criceti]SUN43742.1 putative transcriptional regulator [Streptococcus criceti]
MENTLQKFITQRIKILRKQAGMTQMELEEKAGLGFNYIYKLENKPSNITLSTLYKIIEALEVDIPTFFDMKQGIDEDTEDLLLLLAELPKQKRHEFTKALSILIKSLK